MASGVEHFSPSLDFLLMSRNSSNEPKVTATSRASSENFPQNELTLTTTKSLVLIGFEICVYSVSDQNFVCLCVCVCVFYKEKKT